MPKRARYTLIWVAADERYELREEDRAVFFSTSASDAWWLAWLKEHRSFAFHGRGGHLNLLKEPRARGSDYWYAYRSQNRRTTKRYAGRSSDLTLSHLERLANTFPDGTSFREQRSAASSDAGEMAPTGEQMLPLPIPASFSKRDALFALQPLLEPKFQPPRLQAGLVARERLFAKMDAGLERKLTLLCSPAGYGKTTLTSQWLNARRPQESMPPVIWLALDGGDNDPLRFWRYVVSACRAFHSGLGDALFAPLSAGVSSSFELPSLEMVLTSLLNELVRVDCAGLLILEDYHLITEARIHETLVFFLDHMPARLRVVMLTRSVPPFPLARWRAKGELSEVLASDLCFSPEETRRFFDQVRMAQPGDFSALSEQVLQPLHERVEGWAAGLRLLALASQGGLQPQKFEQALKHFTGGQRLLQEYFVAEVLNAQPQPIQDFLLRTSVLSRLTEALCDALVQRGDSAHLLAAVERAGLFLEALDGSGEWYRYHALFAEAMRAEARRRLGDAALRSLYLSAHQWYVQQNMLPDAIEAAFQAEDAERAAALIERLLEGTPHFIFGAHFFLKIPEFHTLRRWLEHLPQALLNARPLLCLCYAASLTFVCIMEQQLPSPSTTMQLERLLQRAEDGWRREGNTARLGEVLAFRAMILRQPGVMREAVRYARQALALLSTEALEARIMSLWLVGIGEAHQGHIPAAREAFLEARAFYEASGAAAIMRANTVWLSRLDYEQGELHQAAEAYHRLLLEARAAEDVDDICDALLGLAQLSYDWNELPAAEQQAQEAFALACQLTNYELQVQAMLILARIEQARGQIPEAQQRCVAQLVSLPAMLPLRAQLVREIQWMQARLALAQGDNIALERWWASRMESEEISRLHQDREMVLWGRWQMKLGRAEEVLEMLERVLADAQAGGRTRMVLEIQACMALACAARKCLSNARQRLQEVLGRAHTTGDLRLFLDEGEPMATLLQSLLPVLKGEVEIAVVRRLLHAFAQQRAASSNDRAIPSLLLEPLSSQEQRVLHLVTAGRSNPEIARELVVSVNTVKAQVQSIYRKLRVTNRVEASEVARLLKLLP
jgi:LuxR family maltose regulon positive regulatory protein